MLSSVSTATGRASAWPAPAGGPQFVAIDSNGNLTSKVEDGHSWTYEWNAENQLKRVLKDSVEIARFAYDPLGRRVEKVASGAATSYSYDHRHVLRLTTGSASTLQVRGPSPDEILASDAAGEWTFLHHDALASVLRLTNSSGLVLAPIRYGAFGAMEAGDPPAAGAFTGREWEPEISLYYYRARYYDPNIGRFASEDPIRLRGGLNMYGYVSNRPATLIDPLGLQAAATFAAQVVCDGSGGFGISYGTMPADPMLARCIVEHEWDHIDYFTADVHCSNDDGKSCTSTPVCRNRCTGQPQNTGASGSGGWNYWFGSASEGYSEMREWECRGYQVEINCLVGQIRQGGNLGAGLARIRQLATISAQKPQAGFPNGWRCQW